MTRPRTCSCDPGLQRRVQCGDEGEVEGARDGDEHVGRHRLALQSEGAERQRVAHQADADEQRLGRAGEDRPDGDGADEGARAEGGVEDAVVGRLREVDPEVVGGHHRHLPDEGQCQQREHEHGDQAAADHPVVAGHRDAGRQLPPPAGPRAEPAARRGASPS